MQYKTNIVTKLVIIASKLTELGDFQMGSKMETFCLMDQSIPRHP